MHGLLLWSGKEDEDVFWTIAEHVVRLLRVKNILNLECLSACTAFVCRLMSHCPVVRQGGLDAASMIASVLFNADVTVKLSERLMNIRSHALRFPQASRLRIAEASLETFPFDLLVIPLNDHSSLESSIHFSLLFQVIVSCIKGHDDFIRTQGLDVLHYWMKQTAIAMQDPVIQSDFLEYMLSDVIDILLSLSDDCHTPTVRNLDIVIDSTVSMLDKCLVNGESWWLTRSRDFVTAIVKLEWTNKVKYTAIARILDRVGAQFVIDIDPDFLDGLLAAMTVRSDLKSVGGAVITALFGTIEEPSLSSTVNTVAVMLHGACEYVIPAISIGGLVKAHVDLLDAHRRLMESYVLPCMITACPPSLATIFNWLDKCDESINKTWATVMVAMTAKIKGLLVYREIDGVEMLVSKKGDVKLDPKLVHIGLAHESEFIKLQAIRMLIGTVRGVVIAPTAAEFDALKMFLPQCFNIVSPYFRMETRGLLQKIFSRCRDSFVVAIRAKKPDAPTPPVMHLMDDFLNWILDLIISNLNPTATRVRRGMAVVILQVFIECLGEAVLKEKIDPRRKKILHKLTTFSQTLASPVMTHTLVSSLVDPIDSLRLQVYDCLKELSAACFDVASAESLTNMALYAVRSPRLRDGTAGTLIIQYMFLSTVVQHGWMWSLTDGGIPISKVISESNHTLSASISYVDQLAKILQRQVSIARDDIVAASRTDSPHGIMLAIQSVLTEAPQCTDTAWLDVLTRLMATVMDMLSVTLPELSRLVQIASEADDEANESLPKVSVKVLCWLAVRAGADLFGTVAKKFASILSPEQLQSLGEEYFLPLILNARHSGAVERSSVGFQMLNEVLFASHNAKLVRLPGLWLSGQLDATAMSPEQLFILRRSAGLPFVITSILRAEPTSIPRTLLPRTVESLIDLARNHDDMASQVHALNMMRFIFRDGTLSPHRGSHISDALEACLQAVTSDTWALRNSGMLCMVAVLTRALGQKAKPTATLFFEKFPAIHSTLLQQLQSGSLAAEIYPAIVVLSKTLPPQIGNDGSKSPNLFIPHLRRAAANPHVFVRLGAARAISAVCPISDVAQLVDELITALNAASDQNTIHGTLLQIHSLFSRHGGSVEAMNRLASIDMRKAVPYSKALLFDLFNGPEVNELAKWSLHVDSPNSVGFSQMVHNAISLLSSTEPQWHDWLTDDRIAVRKAALKVLKKLCDPVLVASTRDALVAIAFNPQENTACVRKALKSLSIIDNSDIHTPDRFQLLRRYWQDYPDSSLGETALEFAGFFAWCDGSDVWRYAVDESSMPYHSVSRRVSALRSLQNSAFWSKQPSMREAFILLRLLRDEDVDIRSPAEALANRCSNTGSGFDRVFDWILSKFDAREAFDAIFLSAVGRKSIDTSSIGYTEMTADTLLAAGADFHSAVNGLVLQYRPVRFEGGSKIYEREPDNVHEESVTWIEPVSRALKQCRHVCSQQDRDELADAFVDAVNLLRDCLDKAPGVEWPGGICAHPFIFAPLHRLLVCLTVLDGMNERVVQAAEWLKESGCVKYLPMLQIC